jgi:hypothetical protein
MPTLTTKLVPEMKGSSTDQLCLIPRWVPSEREFLGGDKRVRETANIIKVYYMHSWKNSMKPLCIINANKNLK